MQNGSYCVANFINRALSYWARDWRKLIDVSDDGQSMGSGVLLRDIKRWLLSFIFHCFIFQRPLRLLYKSILSLLDVELSFRDDDALCMCIYLPFFKGWNEYRSICDM